MDLKIQVEHYDGMHQEMHVDTQERGFDINEILPVGTGIKSWYVVAV